MVSTLDPRADRYRTRCADLRTVVEPYFNKLAAFQTAEEIRQFLASEGVKAARYHKHSCAIAEYVSSGSGIQVAVGGDIICLSISGDNGFTSDDWFHGTVAGGMSGVEATMVGQHTDAMSDFVQYFDNGFYPELVKEED